MDSITRRVFRSYFTCKRKAQWLAQEVTHPKSFDYDGYTTRKITLHVNNNLSPFEQRFNNRLKYAGEWKIYLIDTNENLPDFYLKSLSNNDLLVPVITVPHSIIKPIDRQELALTAINLAKFFNGEVFAFGFIIYSPEIKLSKIRFSQQLLDKTNDSISQIEAVLNENGLEQVFIKLECNVCPFQSKCFEEAKNIKHLSLLPNISQKRILELKSRGIFTWEQLSYTYRAKKGKSHTLNHIMPLRALAIRQNKIFVNEYPDFPNNKISIFFDIEGLPHENFKYLIGMVIINENNGEVIRKANYWADDKSEELSILKCFLDDVSSIDDAAFFHYGSYEIDYLKSIKLKIDEEYKEICNVVISNSFNILKVLRTHILFPTFSNGLKEISNFLGFSWPPKIQSGYDSIKTRLNWQKNNSKKLKRSLIKYNEFDCFALHLLTSFIKEIKQEKDIVKPSQIEKETYKVFWRDEYALPDMKGILAHAYFDYQREKVCISSIKPKKNTQTKYGYKLQPYKPNTIIEIAPTSCPRCGEAPDKATYLRKLSKKHTDIKFTASGVKRWVIQYETSKLQCICGTKYQAAAYPTGKTHIGFNVKAYIVYQYIFNGLSFSQIKRNIKELFSLKLSGSSVFYYKEHVAQYFRPVYQKLLKKIIASNVIYIDETPFNLEEGTVYGWLLSNGADVVTLYREDRSTDFLLELLADFKGVIVCDFYSAYDRLDCKKQRCLIHLIRDMNNLLLRNSEDTELKVITSNFTKLLADIVKDIELRSKSRQWYLSKFKKRIASCFYAIEKARTESVEAQKLQNRVVKYWGELFEFINHNDIHWNNTVAEHAIKLIATHRNKNLKYLSKKKIEDYMTILTIYQNCQMKGKSFLRFLLNQRPEDIL